MHVRYMAEASPRDKFQGKRTTLAVELPDLEEPETSVQIDPANVPYVPDLYDSKATSAQIAAQKADKALPGEVPMPKVVTAAGQVEGVGVSSNVFQKSEDIKAFVGEGAQNTASKASDAGSTLKGWAQSLGSLQLPGVGSNSSQSGASDPKRSELDAADVQGLYVLLGIIGGGWLLGGLLSKRGTPPAKHSSTH